MKKTYLTTGFEDTQKIGSDIARHLDEKRVLALYGNLGSGKTTFVQGLAKSLGIKQKIISPTFIIIRKYEVLIKNKDVVIKNFYHIDLYRVENENDIQGLGLVEILNDPENIVAIEWPEKIEKLLPPERINVHFEYKDNDTRDIRIG